MFDDVVQDVKAHVESVVSAKTDAVKALLAGIETRFREEHTALVEAVNAHTGATKEQTNLLEVLCSEMKTMNEKMDVLCSHSARLENIERDVATTANAVEAVKDKSEVVSSLASTLDERVGDIGLVVGHKASQIKAVQTYGAAFSGRDLEVMASGVEALKRWTGKTRTTIIYDSKRDPFTDQGLFDKVKGKENIAVIGFTTDGDVFGGFYNVAVMEQRVEFYDPTMFVFSFESHGRCVTPQRFAVKQELKDDANVRFYKNNQNGFVWFGVNDIGRFLLGNESSKSFCCDMSRGFEGLQDTTLTGKTGTYDKGPYHHCARLVAIQLS